MGQAQINVRTRACSGTFIARTKQAALTHNVRGKELSTCISLFRQEQMAICHAPRLVAPPKAFHPSQGGDRNNLIVIPLVQEERTAQERTTHEPQRQQQPIQRQQAPIRKPTLILPQDKWAGGSTVGASAAEHTTTKGALWQLE